MGDGKYLEVAVCQEEERSVKASPCSWSKTTTRKWKIKIQTQKEIHIRTWIISNRLPQTKKQNKEKASSPSLISRRMERTPFQDMLV